MRSSTCIWLPPTYGIMVGGEAYTIGIEKSVRKLHFGGLRASTHDISSQPPSRSISVSSFYSLALLLSCSLLSHSPAIQLLRMPLLCLISFHREKVRSKRRGGAVHAGECRGVSWPAQHVFCSSPTRQWVSELSTLSKILFLAVAYTVSAGDSHKKTHQSGSKHPQPTISCAIFLAHSNPNASSFGIRSAAVFGFEWPPSSLHDIVKIYRWLRTGWLRTHPPSPLL